jgi:uncharacterized membrane-anchored protein
MKFWDINGFLAVLFLVLACLVIGGCIWLISNASLTTEASVLIGGVVGGFQSMMLLIIQFYFRKSKTEKDH